MRTYKTIQGDTWDKISFLAYGDECYIDKLITANMDLRNIALFSDNIEVLLPDIDIDTAGSSVSQLPPWKR